MTSRVGEAGECGVTSYWRKLLGKPTEGGGGGGVVESEGRKPGAYGVEQRRHKLVGRRRGVSVSKILVQSDVYRRSAVRSAESRGRGKECGPQDSWRFRGWVGRSVGV